jgi:uncharacterized repeat protein (TIGR03803 family)
VTKPGWHRDWISGIRPRVASVVLSLAPLLIPTVVAAQTTQGRAYKVLHRFEGVADGSYPIGGLIQDAAGNLYGVADNGGGTGCFQGQGCGTVFKLDVTGKLTVLYRFTGAADGAYPDGLIRDQEGSFYGVAGFGGGTRCFQGQGCGTVFKLDGAGKLTVLYRFVGEADGAWPESLVRDRAGNLYGETYAGGLGRCYSFGHRIGCGTIFKVDTTGKETVLHTFSGNPDGATPSAGVILDATGNLYGATSYGGVYNWGSVFKLNKHKETELYSFSDGRDGGNPYGVIQDKAGNLYGATATGGNIPCGSFSNGCGTVFELDTTGKETVLYSFRGPPDGQLPFAPLIMDKVGNIYGDTNQGGLYGYGTVFRLNKPGKETVPHNFKGSDGSAPEDALIQDGNGNLYGMTPMGGGNGCGGNGCGVIFELSP